MEQASTQEVLEALHPKGSADSQLAFVVGAGCSFAPPANIPMGTELVGEAHKHYPEYLGGLSEGEAKNLLIVMARIGQERAEDLLQDYLDKAMPTFAHLSIAWLMANNHAHYVLTTNFDTLIDRAMAMLGYFPPIHDVTDNDFEEFSMRKSTVFYLHGTRYGARKLLSEADVTRHTDQILRVVRLGRGVTWVVIGCGGASPVPELLSAHFGGGSQFFWVNPRKPDPGLLLPRKTKWIASSADDFMADLVRKNLDKQGRGFGDSVKEGLKWNRTYLDEIVAPRNVGLHDSPLETLSISSTTLDYPLTVKDPYTYQFPTDLLPKEGGRRDVSQRDLKS